MRVGLASKAPTLTVNLFGCFEVRIGDAPVDPARFRRQKVKTLLALLVLNRGREFSRDRLVSLIWPESDLESARKNFYGIWSMLRRALTTPSGDCPYLIRQQQGLRLDARLLSSDVMRIDEVCRELLFERPGHGGWVHLFSEVSDRFSNDLMPSDSDNAAIASMRVDYRNRSSKRGTCRRGCGSRAPHTSVIGPARTPILRLCGLRWLQGSVPPRLRRTFRAADF